MSEERKRSRRQIEAYIEVNVNKIPDSEIIQELMKDGLTETEISALIVKRKGKARSLNIGLIIGGIAFAFFGIVFTIVSYSSVSYYGGDYYVFYGAILVGIIAVIVGIARMASKK